MKNPTIKYEIINGKKIKVTICKPGYAWNYEPTFDTVRPRNNKGNSDAVRYS